MGTSMAYGALWGLTFAYGALWGLVWPMYSSDGVNGNLVGRLEISGVKYRLGSWYEGYAAWDVGNVGGLPGHMHEVRACTEASEEQVQRVGEGNQVWICRISMDNYSKGGCVVNPENNVSHITYGIDAACQV